MRILVDTNIWIRFEDNQSPHQQLAQRTLDRLVRDQVELCSCAQVLIEFWAVASRPIEANGLNFDAARIQLAITKILSATTLLPEPPDIASHWLELASAHQPVGKTVHDLRIVALMVASGVNDILTLNSTDFSRYGEIKVVDVD